MATSLFQQWADGMVWRGQYPEARAASTEDDGRRRRDAWLAEWQTLAEELGRQAPDGGVAEQLLRDRR